MFFIIAPNKNKLKSENKSFFDYKCIRDIIIMMLKGGRDDVTQY